MKKVLLAALMSVAVPGTILAADLGAFKAPPPAGAYDWTGLYFGGHIGGGWADNQFSDFGYQLLTGNVLPITQTTNSSGFLGGVQGGYNYQIGRLVLGSDFDFSWASIDGTNSDPYGHHLTGSQNWSQTLSADTDWIGTATTRLGVARNNWLFYSKAGIAWANTSYTVNNTHVTSAFDQFDGTGSKTLTGWTVGTGLEWAFARNWTAKLEYDFIDFGSNVIPIYGTRDPGQTYAHPQQFTIVNNQYINELKFGLNYKLDPGWLFW